MRRALVAAALALAAPAAAQDRSDLMPPEPTMPPGVSAAGTLYPPIGAALQQQAGAQQPNAPAAGAARGPANGGHGSYVLDGGDVRLSVEEGAPAEVPEVHVVRKGDTLWDISNTYFANPWYWPKLWSFNPLITNPHWIFPGDLVRLYPPGRHVAEKAPVARNLEPETPRISVARPAAPTGILLRQTGFVEPGELAAAGRIVGSREDKIMLATLDEAYVEENPDQPLKPGERYTVYRVVDRVKHPDSGETLGHIVQILGDVEVRGFAEREGKQGQRIARVVITDSVDEIRRGDLVGPLRRVFKMVEPSVNRADIDGTVVAALRPTKLVGSEMLVFIDRGRADGLQVGNRFLVVRRGDAYEPLLQERPPTNERFPREVIAEVVVVDVRERTSTGIVTRALKEVRMGDRVEARRGY